MIRDKRREFLVFVVVIILQLAVILYWAFQKQNFFIDELYSMGYASTFTGRGDTAQYITTSPEWKFNEWVSNADYKHYIILSEDESIFRLSFVEAVAKFMKKNTYEGLLNIAESIYGYNILTARPGIILNILLFVFAEIELLLLLKKLKLNTVSCFLALTMYGFSGYVISMVEYIRFYMLITLFLLVTLNLFYRMLNSDRIMGFMMSGAVLLALMYLSYKNSELTIAYFGAICLCFMVALIVTKQKKKAILTCFAGVCGLLFVLRFTNYAAIFFNPNQYAYANPVAASNAQNIRDISIAKFINYAAWLYKLFMEYYFGSYYIFFGGLVAITIYILSYKAKGMEDAKKHQRVEVNFSSIVLLTVWIGVMVFCLIDRSDSSTIQASLVSVIIVIAILLNIILKALDYKLNTCKIGISHETLFICILIGVDIIYTSFTAVSEFTTWRYYVYGFTIGTIIIWYILDRIIKLIIPIKACKGIYVILTVFVFMGAICPFKTRTVEYIYESDRYLHDAIYPYRNMDVVLASNFDFDKTTSRHGTYDCVNQMSEEADIYAVNLKEYSYENIGLPPTFILWTHIYSDIDTVIEDLIDDDYEIETLGENHISKVYICTER